MSMLNKSSGKKSQPAKPATAQKASPAQKPGATTKPAGKK